MNRTIQISAFIWNKMLLKYTSDIYNTDISPADRDQGGNRGGRSQGDDSRELEREEPSWAQAPVITMAHGGADRGRSHGGGMATDSRGLTDDGGTGGRGAESKKDSQLRIGVCRWSGGPGWSWRLWRLRRRSAVEPEWPRTKVKLAGRKEPNRAGGT